MTNQTTNRQKNILTVPIAIIIAGLIIAGAIIYTQSSGILGGKGGKETTDQALDSGESAGSPTDDSITIRPVSSEDHIRGNKNAEITIIEYSDLECPFCKRFHPTLQQILLDYSGKVRWVYRHFPLTSLHSKAPKEAEATDCAAELGGNDGFWAYIDRLYEVTPSNNGLDLEQLPQIAQDVGLDRQKFKECLDKGKYAQHVQEDYQDAISAGGSGTPYNIVIDSQGNKLPFSGALPYSSVKKIIDSVL